MRLRDEESEPLDYAAELGSRTAGRLVLANRQTEGAGVSPGGPVAEGMRTDTQTETLDGTAGLIGPLPTGRDLDEHGHGEGIARQRRAAGSWRTFGRKLRELSRKTTGPKAIKAHRRLYRRLAHRQLAAEGLDHIWIDVGRRPDRRHRVPWLGHACTELERRAAAAEGHRVEDWSAADLVTRREPVTGRGQRLREHVDELLELCDHLEQMRQQRVAAEADDEPKPGFRPATGREIRRGGHRSAEMETPRHDVTPPGRRTPDRRRP